MFNSEQISMSVCWEVMTATLMLTASISRGLSSVSVAQAMMEMVLAA